MNRVLPLPPVRWLLACALVFTGGSAWGQYPGIEEPRWLRFTIPQVSVGVETEGLVENIKQQGVKSTHEYFLLTPFVGGAMEGSIYHPDLMRFDVSGEGGWGWDTDTTRSPGSDITRNEDNNLLRYNAHAHFLDEKPYNADAYVAQDHTFNNYDFFNTVTVDTFRYGGHAGWVSNPLNLEADAGYREDRTSGMSGSTEVAETYLNAIGTWKRDRGRTSLNYRYDNFDTSSNGGQTQNSVNNSISASDTEIFGSRRQWSATTGASYSQYDYSSRQTETFSANENITASLNPQLDTFLTANYSDTRQDTASSTVVQGMTGLRHRLYESLISSFDVHGNHDESSSITSSSANSRYGLGLHEDYTKKLSSWGRLSMGAGVVLDHEEHESEGEILTVVDEQHTLYLTTNPLYPANVAYLSNPRVLARTILVRNATSGAIAREDVDYRVMPSGLLTEVRLIQGSPILPDGGGVLVSYQSASLYNASFEALTGSAQIRLDLFNRFGIYGRVNWVDNNAPPNVLAETLIDLVGGMDYTWRWFRAGAEYENFDSSFNQYTAWRFFENFNFQPSEASTLGINLGQLFYSYPDGRDETQFQFLARFNSQLVSSFSYYLEGGYSYQDVSGTQQNLGAARAGLNWTRGKLSLRVGYEYNYQLITMGSPAEQRDRNYLFLHLRRTF